MPDPQPPGPHDPPGPRPGPGDPPPPLPPRPNSLYESAMYPGMLSWHPDETCARYSSGHKHLAAA
jgi:hypothetical protein